MKTEADFWAALVVQENGCWEATHLTPSGYGMTWWQGASRISHRLAWSFRHGPIADGLVIDHLCRNRACSNPEHMEPVSQKANLDRAPTALATINAAKTHCPQRHEYSPDNTYQIRTGGRACRACRRAAKQRWLASRKQVA